MHPISAQHCAQLSTEFLCIKQFSRFVPPKFQGSGLHETCMHYTNHVFHDRTCARCTRSLLSPIGSVVRRLTSSCRTCTSTARCRSVLTSSGIPKGALDPTCFGFGVLLVTRSRSCTCVDRIRTFALKVLPSRLLRTAFSDIDLDSLLSVLSNNVHSSNASFDYQS